MTRRTLLLAIGVCLVAGACGGGPGAPSTTGAVTVSTGTAPTTTIESPGTTPPAPATAALPWGDRVPSYGEVLAAYPAEVERCSVDARLFRDSFEIASPAERPEASRPPGTPEHPYKCFGTRVEVREDPGPEALDGAAFGPGTLLTVDAAYRWIEVSSWAEPVLLAYRFEAGSTLEFEVTDHLSMQEDHREAGGPADLAVQHSITLGAQLEVRSVTSDGAAEMLLTWTSLSVWEVGPDGTETSWWWQGPGLPSPGDVDPEWVMDAALLGNGFGFSVTSDGAVGWMSGWPGFVDGVLDSLERLTRTMTATERAEAREVIESSVSPHDVIGDLQRAFPPLPETPVNLGDSWRWELAVPSLPVRHTYRCTVAEIGLDEVLISLDSSTEITGEPVEPFPDTAALLDAAGTAEGTVRVRRDGGIPTGFRSLQSWTGSFTYTVGPTGTPVGATVPFEHQAEIGAWVALP